MMGSTCYWKRNELYLFVTPSKVYSDIPLKLIPLVPHNLLAPIPHLPSRHARKSWICLIIIPVVFHADILLIPLQYTYTLLFIYCVIYAKQRWKHETVREVHAIREWGGAVRGWRGGGGEVETNHPQSANKPWYEYEWH